MTRIHIIPELDNIEEFIEFARAESLAFEYNEFFIPSVLDDEDKLSGIIDTYKGKPLPENCSLHGAFLDITIFSTDSLIREASIKRVRQSLDIARRIGATSVVFHTNYMPTFLNKSYREAWVNDNESFWLGILDEYNDVNIYIENMFDIDPELLEKLAKRLCHKSNFGVCLDYAHACLGQAPIEDWIDKLAPYVKHIHINNNDLNEDLHNPLDDGLIDYEEFVRFYKDKMDGASILLEMRGIDKQKSSLAYLKELMN